jgi:hypothetical protein
MTSPIRKLKLKKVTNLNLHCTPFPSKESKVYTPLYVSNSGTEPTTWFREGDEYNEGE